MLKKYLPSARAKSVFEIDYRKLYKLGFRGILFDIDNTLVHHGDASTPEIDELFNEIHRAGIKTLLLSNNGEDRVRTFNQNINSLFICRADKPSPESYRAGIEMMGIKKNEALCIGDQIFTDILGANRCGISSILVDFIRAPGETKIGKKRYIEKIILKFAKNSLGDFIRGEK